MVIVGPVAVAVAPVWLACCGAGWLWCGLWCWLCGCGSGLVAVLVALCCASWPAVAVALVAYAARCGACLLCWWCWLWILQGWRAALAWPWGGYRGAYIALV